MATRMLIDARHAEETRVAVLKGNRIEEFDFESAEHKQIKGNIYLAKVTRVEPSLQAAFVDFGGNRHGFLAFGEIHPDYYQIPQSDREALLEAEAEAAEEEARLRAEDEDEGFAPGDEYDADDESAEALAEDLAEDGLEEIDTSDSDRVSTIEDGTTDDEDDDGDNDAEDDSDDDDSDDDDSEDDEDNGDDGQRSRRGRGRGRRRQGGGRGRQGGKQGGNNGSNGRSRAKQVDDIRAKRMALRRRYKIQDVIQRRQVLLVQVVKEERGNKGAALTTYLSLAGRYTVLMPNSSHGGGISRKISSSSDRQRLKKVVSDLSLPRSMGLIVRTAGLSRTKTEIKRDFDYLARLWDEIREKTLGSTAPSLVHSDSDLIKRAIRDIYNREIEEVVVEGEAGYKSAKAFMKLLMPSHARRVKAYSDPVPLFQRYGAEDQLRAMYDPMVQLKSGGYLIINPTEALVSIDINSGRSTKEHGIEQTALHTNLEAAREIARQLRLRDMAGLVVIDFIDMERGGNVRKVERAMKDALKSDRARIQVGRISGFGLMEMSRQRLRTGVLEATTRVCPHCDGTGLVRTASSAGLSALRLIEDEAAKGKGTIIRLSASTEAAVYMLNEKRAELVELEQRYGVTVEVQPEGEDEGAKMSVSSAGPRPTEAPKFEPIEDLDDDDEDDADDYDASDDDDAQDGSDDDDRSGRSGRGNSGRGNSGEDDGERPKKRRRRRGGRGRNRSRDERDDGGANDNRSGDDDASDDEDRSSGAQSRGGSNDNSDRSDDDDKPKKRRRRGGRGRRRKSDEQDQGSDTDNDGSDTDASDTDTDGGDLPAENLERVSEQVMADMAVVAGPEGTPETAERLADKEGAEKGDAPEAEKPKPKRKRAPRKAKSEDEGADKEPSGDKPKRKRAPSRKKDDSAAHDDSAAPDGGDAGSDEPAGASAPAGEQASEPAAASNGGPSDGEASNGGASNDPSNAAPADDSADKPASRKRGWWQRTFGE